MQFVITAYDGTDEQALERRLLAREAHLQSIEKNFHAGHHLYGAAILNDAGNMIGSMMVVDYPSREALDAWLNIEPYITGNVWQKIDIQPCNVAQLFINK